MENTRKRRKPVSADAIGRLADEGRDVSRFFTNNGRMTGPLVANMGVKVDEYDVPRIGYIRRHHSAISLPTSEPVEISGYRLSGVI